MATPGPPRQPGSFSPIVPLQSASSRPTLRTVESSSSDDFPALSVPSQQQQQQHAQVQNAPSPIRPSQGAVTFHANSSVTSLQNFSSRPSAAALSRTELPQRNVSPTSLAQKPSTGDLSRGHGRKHSQTQGSFEPYLPTAAHSNLGSMANLTQTLSASQIAAQAAMQHQTQHMRQRSQTVPSPQLETAAALGNRKVSRGPLSPPVLSLTEASGPKDNALAPQSYQNGLLGSQNAAQTAANAVFQKSPGSSPGLPPTDYEPRLQLDKPIKIEKAKNKLFSRPGKIGISKDKEAKGGPLPSPNKLGTYGLGALQRANMSTNSLIDTASSSASIYSMPNSSSATIRAVEAPPEKDKEKHKHHFLSRQKHKLSGKDDHHLPLSSASSNSKPVDPSAPSSLYNFNLPPSPGHASTSFSKSVSGLDLRHGGRALREKKREEKAEASRDTDSPFQNSNEWAGPSSIGSAGGASYLANGTYAPSLYGGETQDFSRFGLNNMGPDDAWPYLRSKLLIVFEGEDLRLPVEDLNRLVS